MKLLMFQLDVDALVKDEDLSEEFKSELQLFLSSLLTQKLKKLKKKMHA